MTDSSSNVHIVVPKELRSRLQNIKHPHQTYAGVIEELLAKNDDFNPDILTKLERYRTHPRESTEDLIVNALEQLQELERKMGNETER